MIMERRENESYEEYEMRLITLKLDGTIRVSWEELHKTLGIKVSVDHFRKVATGKYKASKVSEEQLEALEKEYEERLEELNKELEKAEANGVKLAKERIKVQSLRNNINKIIREESRSELYLEELLEAQKKYGYKPKAKPFSRKEVNGEKAIILNIADMHYGRDVVIKGLKGEVINEYNPKIFEDRMLDLQLEVIKILKEEKINKLHIFNLSDSIDGILRASQLQSLALGITDSVVSLANFMVEWLDIFLEEEIEIEYFSSWGNHNEYRPLNSNSGDFAHENTERIITSMIRMAYRDSPNKDNLIIHDALKYHYTEIAGYKIMATHGQYAGTKESILKDYSFLFSSDIDMLFLGHLHKYAKETVGANEDNNIELVRSPSLCGVDDYATDKLLKNAKAGALVMVLNSNKKIKKTIDIILN